MAHADNTETLDKNWYKDRYQYVLVQRRIWVIVAVAALVCTLGAILVILSLIPQKTIEPYVIQIDQRSGITQYVDPVSTTQLTANEAVKNYFVVAYIRAREGYSSADVFKQYDMVRLMSEPSRVYSGFLDVADPNNPQSNVARFGSLGTRQVVVKSITYLEPQVAQVRAVIEERNDGVSVTSRQHKIILVRFEFGNIPLSAEERYINPLSFRVLDYRVDEDVA